jgi:pimeloyl-ACP methyl ester carboxylesterase
VPTLPHHGIATHYETWGNGPPLMLLAGLAADNAFWLPSRDALAARHTLVMPDNRGAGRTSPLEGATSIRAMADDCIALADHLGLASFSLAGHSMGGMIALDCAIRHPLRIDGLVLAATSPCASARDHDLFATWAALFALVERRVWFRNLFHWVLSPAFLAQPRGVDALVELAASYPWQQTPRALANQVEAIARFDGRDGLSSIRARTLVLAGTADLVFPVDAAAAFASSVKNATFAAIEGAAHSFPIEDPSAFTRRVIDFL